MSIAGIGRGEGAHLEFNQKRWGMCFSATASFGASAFLGAASIVSFRYVRTKRSMMFASIPALFALQQATEGLVWLSKTGAVSASLEQPAIYLFLVFAQVLWPVWVPLSIFLLEENKIHRKRLRITLVAGIFCSLLLLARLVLNPVDSGISHQHIYYNIESTRLLLIVSSCLYFAATIIPPFLSTTKGLRLLGVMLSLSLVSTALFYRQHLVSVWCYFAAFLSIIVIYIMWMQSRKGDRTLPA